MTDITYAQAWSDHATSVGEPGETVTVTVLSGGTVYYGDPSVSSSSNLGSITVGNSATMANPTSWLRSASQSYVMISGATQSTVVGVSLATMAAAMPYVVDLPENHGAKRDGSTDDTAAIQSAINNAVSTCVSNGTNYCEVWFSAGIYQLTAATTKGGSTFGNAQITLPIITSGSSAQKVTLVLKGVDGTSLIHWNQTVGQKSGAVLRTTTTGTNDGTFGTASVVGGPTILQGFGGGTGNAWSNMLVIVDGLRVVSSTGNPTMSGFDFQGVLQAKVYRAGYFVDASASAMAGFVASSGATFTNQWAYGLRMPATNNNDLCVVDDWSCEGAWYGIVLAEHSHVRDMRAVYCGWGILLDNTGSTPHTSHVDFASVEVCVNGIGLLGVSGNFRIDIDVVDFEAVGAGVWDSNSLIYGKFGVTANSVPAKATAGTSARGSSVGIGNWNSTPTNGQFITLRSLDIIPGAFTTNPTVPATTVDFWNGFGRDCVVNISGGTVSVVAIDGKTMGTTSGTFIVPEGKKINLTYSVTPTWTWTAL